MFFVAVLQPQPCLTHLDDLVGDGGLAGGAAAADPDHERLDKLALAVVPDT